LFVVIGSALFQILNVGGRGQSDILIWCNLFYSFIDQLSYFSIKVLIKKMKLLFFIKLEYIAIMSLIWISLV
jgi:hypothetical protein